MRERCQDGWFRGTNRSQKSGVFPGNYVAPLRNTQNESSVTSTSATSNQNQKRAAQLSHFNATNHSIALNKHAKHDTTNPPELPPRLSGSSSTSSSVWSKPIGQHVEAFFGRKLFTVY